MIGTCRLTGAKGKFVKSHLIPKAVTRPEQPGLPFIQGGSGQFARRRWDSWYDKELVTREGEDILSALDDWAIRYLRAQKLLWSGWGPITALGGLHNAIPGTPWGFRTVNVDEPSRLRLFFLSLLWRAAASRLPEFSEVNIPDHDLELLANMLIRQDAGDISFYPATLTQLSTLGVIHNSTPLAQTKNIPELSDAPDRSTKKEMPIFRFYFDGLVTHIHRHSADDGYTNSIGDFFAGFGHKLSVTTVSYESSFEHENLYYVMSETIYNELSD